MSYLDSLKQKIDLHVTVPVTYYLKPAKKRTKKTVLLLHGYQDSASSLFKRAFGEEAQDFDFNIFAPNGIYPVPVRGEQGFREAYAWYFVDAKREFEIVPPEAARDHVLSLINYLNMQDHVFELVGFSQGGILASFVAHKLKNVTGLIGLGTMFFAEYYKGLNSTFPVDAIHGINDDVISLSTSQNGYNELQQQQPRPGDYFPIQNLKHTLDDVAREKLNEIIQKRLFGK